jgi:hypothetical protein
LAQEQTDRKGGFQPLALLTTRYQDLKQPTLGYPGTEFEMLVSKLVPFDFNLVGKSQ